MKIRTALIAGGIGIASIAGGIAANAAPVTYGPYTTTATVPFMLGKPTGQALVSTNRPQRVTTTVTVALVRNGRTVQSAAFIVPKRQGSVRASLIFTGVCSLRAPAVWVTRAKVAPSGVWSVSPGRRIVC